MCVGLRGVSYEEKRSRAGARSGARRGRGGGKGDLHITRVLSAAKKCPTERCWRSKESVPDLWQVEGGGNSILAAQVL